ncbi:MAG: hypothetical protein HRT44_14135, partial [Bdellovibrionales bacterium]|nr:hypothetical protein [Bdellovibrionales bacterium]NQZ20377.1 hypothetical protein [Bdellovibrionales bacterium]
GRWQVNNVSEGSAEFTLHNDYESVGHLAMYGPSKGSVNFLAQGGVNGIMNLVYLANIAGKPPLTPEFYVEKFKGTQAYDSNINKFRSAGDATTEFKVHRQLEAKLKKSA